MKETLRESFRWAAHTGGLAIVKSRDYEPGGEVEAATPYAAWATLRYQGRALRPGDLLENLREDGSPAEMRIAKYVGFEPAEWLLPQQKPEIMSSSPGTDVPDQPISSQSV